MGRQDAVYRRRHMERTSLTFREESPSDAEPHLRADTPRRQYDSDAYSLLARLGKKVTFKAKQQIFGRGDRASTLLGIQSGVVISYRTTSSGRRAITTMYRASDLLGLNSADHHSAACEAATRVHAFVVSRDTIMSMAQHDPRVARGLLAVSINQSGRGEDRIELFATTATERVCSFILRMAAQTNRGEFADLPMRRQDIADYLGLTTETVCRTITQLRTSRVIRLETVRRAQILNRNSLERMSGASI